MASPDELNEARRIFVRCSGGDVPESLEELLATYEALDPRKSFATPLDVPLFCIDARGSLQQNRRPGTSPPGLLLETRRPRTGRSRRRPRQHLHDEPERNGPRLVLRSPKVPVKPSTFLARDGVLEAVGRQ